MKIYKIKYIAIAVFSVLIISCDNNDEDTMTPVATDFSGTFSQKDQIGRPAVNTVFVSADSNNYLSILVCCLPQYMATK
ncbi:MAG: hypothetical protein ACJA1B_002000 [Polaribacter sp.]|jgi:hypothetical protein